MKMLKGELLGKCLKLMIDAHDGQFDKGGQPYCLHPLKVMHYLKTTDEELQCIALLHDVVEDTYVTFGDLYEIGCTNRVVEGVNMLTKMKGQTYEAYKINVFSNIDAMHVKLCDLRHNTDIRRLKGVTEKDIDRIAKYQRFYLEIQKKLAEIT